MTTDYIATREGRERKPTELVEMLHKLASFHGKFIPDRIGVACDFCGEDPVDVEVNGECENCWEAPAVDQWNALEFVVAWKEWADEALSRGWFERFAEPAATSDSRASQEGGKPEAVPSSDLVLDNGGAHLMVPVACIECPWRRGSTPGWLGPHTPESFTELARTEAPIACHMTIRSETDWSHCRGAAIYRTNTAKRPRDPSIPIAEKDDGEFFASPHQFESYHGGHRSKLL